MKGILALIVLIPLIMPIVSSCAEGQEWLVMVYMSGENNLAKMADSDLDSILSFGSEELAWAVLYDDLGPSKLYM